MLHFSNMSQTEISIVTDIVKIVQYHFFCDFSDIDISFERHERPEHYSKFCVACMTTEEWGARVIFFEKDLNTFILSACHELVHVKQRVMDGLIIEKVTGHVYFRDKKHEKYNYDRCPWELEAYTNERDIFDKYARNCPDEILDMMVNTVGEK